MVRRIARAHDNAVIAICPNCKTCSKFFRTPNPHIDSCGFESYFFACEECKAPLAGIIDPINEELLVSALEPTSVITPQQKSGLRDEVPYRLRRKVHSDDSGIEAAGLSRLPISLLGLKAGTFLSGTSTITQEVREAAIMACIAGQPKKRCSS
jgi:hypothetical protein